MDGGGIGEVCGEVTTKHLTIGKADEQQDSGWFGEVSTCFPMKMHSVDVALLAAIVGKGVRDVP